MTDFNQVRVVDGVISVFGYRFAISGGHNGRISQWVTVEFIGQLAEPIVGLDDILLPFRRLSDGKGRPNDHYQR